MEKKFAINGREKASYELTNNEILSLYQNGNTDVIPTMFNRFVYGLCNRPGETEDETFARYFGDFVNGKMNNKEKVALQMAKDHRYLQQEMFKVCLEYIKVLAENYDKGYYDPRNEWACETSKKIIEAVNAY